MSLLVDKYRPKKFDDLDYHLSQAEYLNKLVERTDFPHILIYGPSGSGKKTRLSCLLKGLFGSGSEKLKLENMTFQNASNKKIDINVVTSSFHIEINPSDVGVYDRIVIQELIKQTAQTFQLDSRIRQKFKVVVLMEAERLTKDAQHGLRRTMEKYAESCRVVLVAESLSSIIEPIQSRCLCVRVSSPSIFDTTNVINKVCHKENINIPLKLSEKIYKESGGNLRRGLLMLETCRVTQYPFSEDQNVELPQWQIFLRDIAKSILQSQTSEKLLEIRGKLYELLSRCIPTDIIMRELVNALIPYCEGIMKNELIQLAAEYESRIRKGSKAIFHLEAFIAHFMAVYKRFIDEGIAELF